MEFYIKNLQDPNYQHDKLQLDDDISLILTQLETILFTPKGSVLGDVGFGCDLNSYIYELRYNDFLVKNEINKQIGLYIPLASKYPISVEIDMVDQIDRHIMFVDITVDSKFQLGIYV